MDFKISNTYRGKKSLLHNGYSYRIDALNSRLANGRTMVVSRYHNFGLGSEIQSKHRYTLKIPVKAINFCPFKRAFDSLLSALS